MKDWAAAFNHPFCAPFAAASSATTQIHARHPIRKDLAERLDLALAQAVEAGRVTSSL